MFFLKFVPGKPLAVLNSLNSGARYRFNQMIAFTLGSSMIVSANADRCFETPSGLVEGDNTLYSLHNENELFLKINSTCKVLNEGLAYCADFAMETFWFGKGAFGGATCSLTIHQNNLPDPCAMETVDQHCKSGYGTTIDVIATISIVLAGITVICCVGKCANSLYKNCQQAHFGSEEAEEYKEFAEEEKIPVARHSHSGARVSKAGFLSHKPKRPHPLKIDASESKIYLVS